MSVTGDAVGRRWVRIGARSDGDRGFGHWRESSSIAQTSSSFSRSGNSHRRLPPVRRAENICGGQAKRRPKGMRRIYRRVGFTLSPRHPAGSAEGAGGCWVGSIEPDRGRRKPCAVDRRSSAFSPPANLETLRSDAHSARHPRHRLGRPSHRHVTGSPWQGCRVDETSGIVPEPLCASAPRMQMAP